MAYEFVIRTREPATADQLTALHGALRQAAAVGLAGWQAGETLPSVEPLQPGARVAIANGEAKLAATFVVLETGTAGVDLTVDHGGTEAELRDALRFALALGGLSGMVLYDPQLTREISGSDVEQVVEAWRRTQAWAMDFAGTAEDPRGMPLALQQQESSGAKKIAIVFGVIVLLVLLLRSATPAPSFDDYPPPTPVERIPPNLAPPPPGMTP